MTDWGTLGHRDTMAIQIGDVIVKGYFYVYGLLELDTGATRYIGKTLAPHQRLLQHLNSSGPRSAMRYWLNEVQGRGSDVGMRILAICNSDDEALLIEHKLITESPFRLDLLNMSPCPGGIATAQVRARAKKLVQAPDENDQSISAKVARAALCRLEPPAEPT